MLARIAGALSLSSARFPQIAKFAESVMRLGEFGGARK
jgi:hypothetical protein